MKLDFRQRLLTTTLLVGASMVASPVFAQTTPPATPSPPDNSATPSVPETTTPVEGQTTVPSTNAQGGTVRNAQDIVITGTRIPQPNLTSASPVTVLSSQEVKLQGTTRTEDLINSLPQSFASQGSNISNGSTGTATVNLRGLGSARTLVLINGRRLQPGDPRQGSVADINFVPSSLVKRVDVLTGGASSVYGADAVAGVVNFIMDTNFRGLRIDGQASTFMHNNDASDKLIQPNLDRGFHPPHGWNVNGGAQDISAAFGAGFDDNRGSILAYATYRKQDPVLQASRDYSFCALGTTYTADTPFYCGGSSTSAEGVFRTNSFHPSTGKTTLVARHLAGFNTFAPGTTVFNFAPYNFYQRPDERYTLGAFAEYEISPGAKPYLEAMFMDDTSNSQIAPSGSFNSVTTIACDNALLSAQEQALLCAPSGDNVPLTFTGPLNGMQNVLQSPTRIARRNVEGGGRQDHLEHTAYRLVGGVRGDLLRGVTYDAYYQFGTTHLSQIYTNDMSVTRLQRATDVIAVLNGAQVAPGTPGATLVCRAAFTGIDPNCVPYNIFQQGGVTQEALQYLQTPLFLNGHVNEQVANANFTLEGGEYGIQTPWSDRGVGLNVGGEYRKEALETHVDENFRLGEGAGQGGPTLPVAGSFSVREAFAELQVPIISHSFIEEFTLTGGYRYSDYNVADHHFNTDTYKISAELAPIHDVRLRASYNRAVRAPNVVELFASVGLGLAGSNDPCANQANGLPSATAAQCLNTGVSAAQYGTIPRNPANQYNALFGGNTALSPETADTYTLGAVLQPRWVPGLALTFDYFNIKVKDLIGTLGFSTIMTQCLQTGDPFFCSKIHRDSAGTLWLDNSGFIELTNTNIGGLETSGIDVNGSYSHRFGGTGTLNVSLVGTWLDKLVTDTGVVPTTGGGNGKFDCAALFGATCGTPNPEWRHKLRVGFTFPNGIGVSGQWRYFSKVTNDITNSDPDMPGGVDCVVPGDTCSDHQINAQSFFDLVLTARLADRYNFRLGANNIFDKQPPVVSGNVAGAPFGNGNTFPQVYDALGRYLFAGVTIDF